MQYVTDYLGPLVVGHFLRKGKGAQELVDHLFSTIFTISSKLDNTVGRDYVQYVSGSILIFTT